MVKLGRKVGEVVFDLMVDLIHKDVVSCDFDGVFLSSNGLLEESVKLLK